MSVPKGQRAESPFELQVMADDFVVHTIRIMSNEKVFDPRYSALADRVVDTAIDALVCLEAANDIYVNDDPSRWAERRSLQVRACSELMKLKTLLRVCRSTYHLRRGKYEHWAGLLRDTLATARKWRDSDAKRNRHLSSGQ